MTKLVSLRKREGGFTLIELMIVVAIIGILAAIAIPNFLRFQLRAKAGEGKTNLAAIRTAEEGYNAEFSTYVVAAPNPAAVPPGQKVPWLVPSPGCPACFDTLGWSPEGDVYYQYEVVGDAVAGPAGGVSYSDFWAAAASDIDNNGTNNEWAYVHPVPGQLTVAATPSITTLCQNTGVFNPTNPAQNMLDTVGPCDQKSGQSEF